MTFKIKGVHLSPNRVFITTQQMEKHTEAVRTKISKPLLTQLQKKAEKNLETPSSVIRKLIKRYVQDDKFKI